LPPTRRDKRPANRRGPRFADLESGLGASPRGFESRILRHSHNISASSAASNTRLVRLLSNPFGPTSSDALLPCLGHQLLGHTLLVDGWRRRHLCAN
jgi:hypothetical protein